MRLDRHDGFRPLHIDEAKYLTSQREKFECRKCHKPVSKVPHTGAAEVDCTTEGHVEDRETIEEIDLSIGQTTARLVVQHHKII